jgi:hypothetical protein
MSAGFTKHMLPIQIPKWPYTAGILIALLYNLPLIVLGENSHIQIHDNLDSNFVWTHILANSGLIFGPNDAIIPDLLGGIPRVLFGSEFKLTLWLYALFGSFNGYVIAQILMHVLAFAGMFRLSGLVFNLSPSNRMLMAVAFSFLPFWPPGGLMVAGQPLLASAFYRIYQQKSRWIDWAIITFFPFFASFVGVGIFIIAVLIAVMLVARMNQQKPFNTAFATAVLVFTVTFMLVEHRLVYNVLVPLDGFVSHRTEFAISNGVSGILSLIKASLKLMLEGQYHATSLHQYIILPAIGFALVYAIIKKQKKQMRILAAGMSVLFLISLFSVLYRSELMLPVKEAIPFLKVFQADRFYMFFPIIWFGLFGYALMQIQWHRRILLPVVLVLQIVLAAWQHPEIKYSREQRLTFAAFFAVDAFSHIRDFLKKEGITGPVGCVGFHPAVAQYNGLHTIGGYFPNYPLSYKHQFGKIIAQELAKSPLLADKFYNWGNRCYLFSADLGYHLPQPASRRNQPIQLHLNKQVLIDLGCRYLISLNPVLSFPFSRDFAEVGKFWSPGRSVWFYVYSPIAEDINAS